MRRLYYSDDEFGKAFGVYIRAPGQRAGAALVLNCSKLVSRNRSRACQGNAREPKVEICSMPEVIFTGPDGRLEGRYQPSSTKTAPIALVLHPHPRFGGTMNNQIVYKLFYMF